MENKPRMVKLSPGETQELGVSGNLDQPFVMIHEVQGIREYWADADELRAWRLAHSQEGLTRTSGEDT
jgi:hypothetical protein